MVSADRQRKYQKRECYKLSLPFGLYRVKLKGFNTIVKIVILMKSISLAMIALIQLIYDTILKYLYVKKLIFEITL